MSLRRARHVDSRTFRGYVTHHGVSTMKPFISQMSSDEKPIETNAPASVKPCIQDRYSDFKVTPELAARERLDRHKAMRAKMTDEEYAKFIDNCQRVPECQEGKPTKPDEDAFALPFELTPEEQALQNKLRKVFEDHQTMVAKMTDHEYAVWLDRCQQSCDD